MGPYYDRAAAAAFGERHSPRSITVGAREWSYLRGGRGRTTVLFLHGLGDAYDAGNLFLGLEDELRFIAPFVPPVASLDELADGLTAILDHEGVSRVVVAGISFGALLAQSFFHRRRDRVAHLFLADAFGPDRRRGVRNSRNVWSWDYLPLFLLRATFRLRMRFLLNAPGQLEPGQQAALDYARERLATAIERLDRETGESQTRLGVEAFLNDPVEAAPLAGWIGKIVSIGPDDVAGLQAGQAVLHRVFPSAERITLQGAGYVGTLVRPEVYRDALRRLL